MIARMVGVRQGIRHWELQALNQCALNR